MHLQRPCFFPRSVLCFTCRTIAVHCCAGPLPRDQTRVTHEAAQRVSPSFPPSHPPLRLSRSTRLSSLGSPAASHSLRSITFTWYCIYFNVLSPFSSPFPYPCCVRKSVLYEQNSVTEQGCYLRFWVDLNFEGHYSTYYIIYFKIIVS